MRSKKILLAWIAAASVAWLWLLYLCVQDVLRIGQAINSVKAEVVLFGVLAAITLVMLWLFLKLLGVAFLAPLDRLQARLGWAGYWAGVLALLGMVTTFLLFTGYGTVTYQTNLRWAFFIGAAAAIACLQPCRIDSQFHWPAYLGGMAVFGSLLAFSAQLGEVTSYPFQLYWSEGNRFWDYSLLYGSRLYQTVPGQPLSAFIDRGRQALWGLPFLFGDLTIFQMRLWSVLVFSVPYMLLGWFIFRTGTKHRLTWLILGLWSFLFLNQGPIYTPLVLAAILVVGGRRLPFWLQLVLVGLAGYYAQISRYTWMFAPAIWAGLIAFLETRPQGSSAARRWLRAIALAGAGLLGGVVIPRLGSWIQSIQQMAQSGAPAAGSGLAGAVTRQPLLWERLLPNPTYPLGILISLTLAAGPLLILVLGWFLSRRAKMDVWQKLALVGALAVFLAVGLVASVKIGGGSNLHNLDMFLVGLLIAAGLAWESGTTTWLAAGDQPADGNWLAARGQPLWRILLPGLLVFYPAAQVFQSIDPRKDPDPRTVSAALDTVRSMVDAAKTCGEVLFIDNRQLITFGYITNVPMISDYEKKRMMDEAMADNSAYFEPFYTDLANHRFAMIVTELLYTGYQGDRFEFGNENDAWVKWVSRPVLEDYTPIHTLKDVGVQLLVPQGETCNALSQ